MDIAIAAGLKTRLEEFGLKTWLAQDDIRPGTNFAEEITDALINSSVLLVILSKTSLSSAHVKREVNMSVDNGLQVIPVILGTPEEFISQLPEDWKYWLAVIQVLQFEDISVTANKIFDVLTNSNSNSLSQLKLFDTKHKISRKLKIPLFATFAVIVVILGFYAWRSFTTIIPSGALEILPKVTNIAAPMNDLLPALPDQVRGYVHSETVSSRISINTSSWKIPQYWRENELYDDCGASFWVLKWEIVLVSDGSISQAVASPIAFLSDSGKGGLPQKGAAGYMAAPGCMFGAFKLPKDFNDGVAVTIEYTIETWLRNN